jgi:hypothetical protein
MATLFRTEHDAWTAIADTLEMLEALPPFYRLGTLGWTYNGWLTVVSNRPCEGLCDVVNSLYNEGLVTRRIYQRMDDRIVRVLDQLDKTWLAAPGEWPSRVSYARLFAEQARRGRRPGRIRS